MVFALKAFTAHYPIQVRWFPLLVIPHEANPLLTPSNTTHLLKSFRGW